MSLHLSVSHSVQGGCFLRGGCLLGGGGGGGDPPGTATAAGVTHPTGMHSCFVLSLVNM